MIIQDTEYKTYMIQKRIHICQNKEYKICPKRNRLQTERLGLYNNGRIQDTRLVLLRVEYRIQDQPYKEQDTEYKTSSIKGRIQNTRLTL